ncbi:MAG: PocR ligand-binding domain-containing protein [Clostridia bacterium]|nr:PocR ligand-binding domain-containing protein [Clostridia bacterium]
MENGIFALIPRARLEDVLGNLHDFVGLPIQLIDGGGELLLSFGKSTRYCALIKQHVFTRSECFELHRKAGEYAMKLGEAYIFTCHANLNHIAFPLINQGDLLGSIIIGPFLMDEPDSTLVTEIAEKQPVALSLCMELYDELSGLQVIEPAKVKHLRKLIDHLLSPLLPSEREMMRQTQGRLYQQSRINETIQMYKEQEISTTQRFIYDKENALLAKVRTGSIQDAKALLNDLLGYVFFTEGGKVDAVRMRAIELTTLLSRIAIEGGARVDSVYELNGQFLSLLSRGETIEDLCYLLQDVVESFMSAMFSRIDKGNVHIRRALAYIAEHYAEPITLESVAGEVGLSVSYFSGLFHEVVGASFREHLCSIRVEESKQLLTQTDYSLADIAVAVGFADQSYFSKVFKRIVGVTPGKYRY